MKRMRFFVLMPSAIIVVVALAVVPVAAKDMAIPSAEMTIAKMPGATALETTTIKCIVDTAQVLGEISGAGTVDDAAESCLAKTLLAKEDMSGTEDVSTALKCVFVAAAEVSFPTSTVSARGVVPDTVTTGIAVA